jgi:hypothetical protein
VPQEDNQHAGKNRENRKKHASHPNHSEGDDRTALKYDVSVFKPPTFPDLLPRRREREHHFVFVDH